jgi:MFS family permease
MSALIEIFPAVVAAFADYFGLGAMTPLLPFFVQAQDPAVADAYVGYILTAQYSGVVLGSAIVGTLSDRLGRRTVLLAALTGDVVFFTLTGFITDPNLMIVVRFFAGCFVSQARAIIRVSLVLDERERLVTYRSSSISIHSEQA